MHISGDLGGVEHQKAGSVRQVKSLVLVGFLIACPTLEFLDHGLFLLVQAGIGFPAVIVGKPFLLPSAVEVELLQEIQVLEDKMAGAFFVAGDGEIFCVNVSVLPRLLCHAQLFVHVRRLCAPAVQIVHNLLDVRQSAADAVGWLSLPLAGSQSKIN